MPLGWIEIDSSAGGIWFDLKKKGDKAVIQLTGEPFVLDIHNIPDLEKPYGYMVPCGQKDRAACPICHDRIDEYFNIDEITSRHPKANTRSKFITAAKKMGTKVYYGAFVERATIGGVMSEVNEYRVLSGGAMLHNGFMDCLRGLAEFGTEQLMLTRPLIIQRSGEGTDTRFAVQLFPQESFAIHLPEDEEPINVTDLAMAFIDKVWEEIGFDPAASPTPASPPPAAAAVVKATTKEKRAPVQADEADPFLSLPA